MRFVYSDPDFTGYPLPAGSPPAWWILTADQWYVITRILYREYVRAHAFRDPGQKDPDDKELTSINYQVRTLLTQMVNDPSWSRIAWGYRIPWGIVACYANRRAEDPSNFFGTNLQYCSQNVVNDPTYLSGLASLNSSLDPVEPYADPVNSWRYEQGCDDAYNQVLVSHSLSETKDQQATYDTVEGGGTSWLQQLTGTKPFNWFMGPLGALLLGGAGYGIASLVGAGRAGKWIAGGAGAVAGVLVGGRL